MMVTDHKTTVPRVTTSSSPEEINRACQLALAEPYRDFVECDDFDPGLQRAITTAASNPALDQYWLISRRHFAVEYLGKMMRGVKAYVAVLEHQATQASQSLRQRTTEAATYNDRRNAILGDEIIVFILQKLGFGRLLARLAANDPQYYMPAVREFDTAVCTSDQYLVLLDLHEGVLGLGLRSERAAPRPSDPEIAETMVLLEDLWGDFPVLYRCLTLHLDTPFEAQAQALIDQVDEIWYNADDLITWRGEVTALRWLHEDLAPMLREAQQRLAWLADHNQDLPAGFRGEARKLPQRFEVVKTDPVQLQKLIDRANELIGKARPSR